MKVGAMFEPVKMTEKQNRALRALLRVTLNSTLNNPDRVQLLAVWKRLAKVYGISVVRGRDGVFKERDPMKPVVRAHPVRHD